VPAIADPPECLPTHSTPRNRAASSASACGFAVTSSSSAASLSPLHLGRQLLLAVVEFDATEPWQQMVVAHGNGGQDQTSLNPYVPIHQPFAVPICALVGPAHGYRQAWHMCPTPRRSCCLTFRRLSRE
jgi:hypothetical protein